MDYSRAGVKNAAKASLRGRRPSPRMVTLVFLALTLLPSLILSLVQGLYLSFLVMEANYLYPYHIHAQIQGSRWIFAFLYLLCYLFSLIFQTGFIGYGMDLYRRRETGYAALFAPLSQVGRVLLLSLLVLVFTFLWTLGLTLIYALLVSLFPYQLREAASVLLMIPLLILLLARLLRYALAYNAVSQREQGSYAGPPLVPLRPHPLLPGLGPPGVRRLPGGVLPVYVRRCGPLRPYLSQLCHGLNLYRAVLPAGPAVRRPSAAVAAALYVRRCGRILRLCRRPPRPQGPGAPLHRRTALLHARAHPPLPGRALGARDLRAGRPSPPPSQGPGRPLGSIETAQAALVSTYEGGLSHV